MTATESDFTHVEAVVARAGSSFRWAMRLLDAKRRRGLHAVYAYCRELDDIADDPGPAEGRRAALSAWRMRLAALHEPEALAGAPPTARALAAAVRTHGLPMGELLAVLEGMEMDLEGPIVAPDEDTLALYCRRVAGAPGLLSCAVFGCPPGRADAFALALGDALQLTNILRDVAEDAAVGRLYLPAPLLAAHGVPPEPAAALAHPGLAAVRADLAVRAAGRFAAAAEALPPAQAGTLRPALVMGATYRRLLEAMAARGWHDLGRPRLGPLALGGAVLRGLAGRPG